MLIESFLNATSSSTTSSPPPWYSNLALKGDAAAAVGWLEKEYAKNALWVILVGLVILILIQFVLGPFLWNNVLRKLFPRMGLGSAAWYDVFALHILLALLIPAIQPAAWLSPKHPGLSVAVQSL
jgi:hypothetical protein